MGTEEGRTSIAQLVKNAIYSSGGWVINIGLVLVVTPYLVFKLGSEGYGVYSLLMGLLGYYNLADLGLGQSITKYVAQYEADENYAAINHSINAALITQVAIGTVVSVGVFGFSDSLLRLLRVSKDFRGSAEIGLYICGISFLFQVVGSTLSSVLKGLQRYDLSSKLVVFTQTLKNIGIAGALYFGGGLLGVVFAAGGSAVLLFFLNLVFVYRKLEGWSLLDGTSKAAVKELFSFSFYLFISRLANLFQNHIVRFVISFFLGPSAVTFYMVPHKVVNAGIGIMRRASGTLLPYASELGELNDKQQLQRTFVQGTKLMMSIALPLFLLTILFSKPLMTVWMGVEFAEKTWPYLSLLAVDKILSAFAMVPILLALGMGHARVRAYFSLVAVILYAALLPLLTSVFGLYGTVFAAIISALPGLVFAGYVGHKLINYSVTSFAYKTVSIHVVPIIFVGVVFLLGLNDVVPLSLWGLLISVPIGVLYIVLMYVTGWMPSVMQIRDSTIGSLCWET